MTFPPLIYYKAESEYRDHYIRTYCRQKIVTHDKIPVYFKPQRFQHAFYEGVGKCEFSFPRAQRINWVKSTLENSQAALYEGWHKDKYVPDRRVSYIYEDFVVIVSLSLDGRQSLKGNFITCYVANRSIKKIIQSPVWSVNKCIDYLIKKGKIGR